MCGICGQYNFGSLAPVQRRDIEAMTKSLAHRGPDDEGYYFAGPLGLGFRRLSIIDLKAGHQPMSDWDESVWVVFNGEIYNFLELKKELEDYGHVFRTKSDTEVIIHGYKQWGDDVLNHLNGMFGLAIWDVRQKRLILARDPFGIKLLYYKIDQDSVHFGSEIRAIRAASPEQLDVDAQSLNLFLRYRYTPSPNTILKDVRKLAPGTKLVFENGSYQLTRWYEFKPSSFEPPKSTDEAMEELLAIYKRAVRRQLISDVPVGLLLSGGIDSGLLLALMNLSGGPWPTYTIGYGATYADDELVDATETAQILGSKHTNVLITRPMFEQALSKIVASLEEPIAASSIVPMYFVCERARQDVKVALVGQGPDELFGGYRRHLGVRYGSCWGKLPEWTRAAIASAIAALPRNETLKRGTYALAVKDRLQRYQHVLSLLPGTQVDDLFQDGLIDSNAADAVPEGWADLRHLMPANELGGLQFLEVRSTLPDELLMYADKLSMAHGLELRVPYLDKEVVEYVERLPANVKVRNGSRKWLHRRICRSYLSDGIVKRRKRGFAVNAVDDWFRDTVNGRITEILLDTNSKAYRYLRPVAVRRLFEQHASGREDNHKLLFSLVVFEEWLRANDNVLAAVN